jgi:hypothetical protein
MKDDYEQRAARSERHPRPSPPAQEISKIAELHALRARVLLDHHVWIRPATSNELAVPAQQRLRLDREACAGGPRQRAGSAPPATRDQPASASAVPPAGAGSPTRGAGRGSPTPSSDAAAPATTRERTGSARRDTRTTRASSPPLTTTRAANLTAPTGQRAADEFANPTRQRRSSHLVLVRATANKHN